MGESMNIAIIPARGGSQRIPFKNIRLFHGKPILAYAIEAARASKLFNEIIVSTDNERIVAVAKRYMAKVHMRPARLAVDTVGTQEVMKCALNWWNICRPTKKVDFAACLYATAPLMTAADIRRCHDAVLEHHLHYAYIEGWCYYGAAANFLAGVPLGKPDGDPLNNSSVHRLSVGDRWIDINEEADWQRAERLYSEMKEGERHESARV